MSSFLSQSSPARALSLHRFFKSWALAAVVGTALLAGCAPEGAEDAPRQLSTQEPSAQPEAVLWAEEGQREKATRIACACPKGTVGFPICKILSGVTPVVGNFGAGKIGDFYEQNQADLNQPDSDANILAFTTKETENFENEPDPLAHFLGGTMTAEQRADLVKLVRDLYK